MIACVYMVLMDPWDGQQAFIAAPWRRMWPSGTESSSMLAGLLALLANLLGNEGGRPERDRIFYLRATVFRCDASFVFRVTGRTLCRDQMK